MRWFVLAAAWFAFASCGSETSASEERATLRFSAIPDHDETLLRQKYAPIANGQRQSPINIEPAKCVFDSNLRANPLTYKYDPNKATSLVNTGMSAQIKYDSEGSSK